MLNLLEERREHRYNPELSPILPLASQ